MCTQGVYQPYTAQGVYQLYTTKKQDTHTQFYLFLTII